MESTRFVACFAIVCSLGVWAAPTPIDRALEQVHARQYAAAAETLRTVKPPQDAAARLRYFRLLASIRSGLGDARGAADAIRQAVPLAPEDRDLRFAAAVAEAKAGMHPEAAEDFERAAALANGQPEILYNAAAEHFRANQGDAALAIVTRLQRDHDTAEVEDLAADLYEQRGDLLASVRARQKAVSLAPGDERYRLSLGMELLRHESLEPALVVFRQAAELFPHSAKLYAALGLACYFAEKHDESVSALIKAVELDPSAEAPVRYLGLTQIRRSDGPSPDAVKAICRRADGNPSDTAANTWCGAMLFEQRYLAGETGGMDGIVRRLESARSLAPADGTANCNLGKALWRQNCWQAAREPMEICAQHWPGIAEYHLRLIAIYRELGLAEKSKEQAELTRKIQQSSAKEQSNVKTFLYEILN